MNVVPLKEPLQLPRHDQLQYRGWENPKRAKTLQVALSPRASGAEVNMDRTDFYRVITMAILRPALRHAHESHVVS